MIRCERLGRADYPTHLSSCCIDNAPGRGRIVASSGFPPDMLAVLRHNKELGVAPLPAMQRLLRGERVAQYDACPPMRATGRATSS